MESIIVNDEKVMKAEVIVSNKLVNDQVIIEGVMRTNNYTAINKIETLKFVIDGVQVIGETFSTENNVVIYNFIAEDIEVFDMFFETGEKDFDEEEHAEKIEGEEDE